MAKFERESLAEDVQGRFDECAEHEQCATKAIMEAYDCNIEDALTVVENGDYDFHPGIQRMDNLVHVLIQEGFFGDPGEMGALRCYIDYDGLSAFLRDAGYIVTSLGAVRVRRWPESISE